MTTTYNNQQAAAEKVRFHIDQDEYEHGEHGQPLDVHGMPVAAADRPAQGAYVPAGAAAPGAASGALLNNGPHHQTAIVPGAHGPAPALGLFPRDMLVRFRSAPALAIITIYLMIVMLAWFVNTIVLVSVRDEAHPSATRDSTGFVQILVGPLRKLSSDFYYSYGHEAIDSVLSLAVCWAAVIHRSRQLRATALFATTWVVFSWLIYTKYIFQGLDSGFEYCNDAAFGPKWCRLSKANGAFSVMMEIGKVAAWVWAISRFIETKHKEPYCEADRADIDLVANSASNTNLAPMEPQNTAAAARATNNTATTTTTTTTAPGVYRVTTVADCRLTTVGKVVLFLSVVSTLGFIISMLGNIETQRLGFQTNQPGYSRNKAVVLTGPYVDGGAVYPGIVVASVPYQGVFYALPGDIPAGDLNWFYNEVFTALLLFFAVGLSVACAYDRVQDSVLHPAILTLFSTMACFGYFIYMARRVSGLAENQSSIHPAYGSQVAIVVGVGITACAEALRFLALVWKHFVSPPSLIIPEKRPSLARPVFKFIGFFFDILLVIVLIAYFIVLLSIQSEEGLFNFTPDSNGVTVQNAVTPIVQGSILAQASAACAAGGATGSAINACAQAALAAKTSDGTVAAQVTAVAARIYGPATPLAAPVGYLHNNPRTTYLNGQQTAEDAMVFPYQMFVISLLIGAWCIGQNFYARLRDDRVGNFVAWTTFTVMCAGWWLMLWPIAYAFAFSEGQAYQVFCRTLPNGDYAFSENLCDETTSAGRLGIIFWILLMLNMFVVFVRMVFMPSDVPLMEVRIAAAEEIARRQQGGVPVKDERYANTLMVAEEKPRHRHLITLFTLITLAGFCIWAAASTDEATLAFWVPAPALLRASTGFDLYYFVSSHFITLSMIVSMFVHAHLAMNPTFRHFSYFFRFAELVASLFNLILAIPVLIYMARFVDADIASSDQTAMFAGMVVLVAGEFMNLVYCQTLFRRYPLFTTPAEYQHFTRRGQAQWKAEHGAEMAAKQKHAAANDHRV